MNTNRPFENLRLKSLTKTRRRPSEWGGWLTDGRRLYALADSRHIKVAIGDTVAETLEGVLRGKPTLVSHSSFTSEVSTDEFIAVTGMHFSVPDTKESMAGEIL